MSNQYSIKTIRKFTPKKIFQEWEVELPKIRRLVKYTSVENILKLGDWLNEDTELYNFLKKNEHENIYISFTIDEHFSKAMWKRRSDALALQEQDSVM